MTKGGWRAVVVDVKDNGKILFWHSHGEKTLWHDFDGIGPISFEYDATKQYTEPRRGTVWVNVWGDTDDGRLFALAHIDKDEYEQDVSENGSHKLISSVKYDWTENEKL